jgi:hypothetical protein
MAKKQNHTASARLCPGCNTTQTFPDRNETCSSECALVLSKRRALAGTGAVPISLVRALHKYEAMNRFLKDVAGRTQGEARLVLEELGKVIVGDDEQLKFVDGLTATLNERFETINKVLGS